MPTNSCTFVSIFPSVLRTDTAQLTLRLKKRTAKDYVCGVVHVTAQHMGTVHPVPPLPSSPLTIPGYVML